MDDHLISEDTRRLARQAHKKLPEGHEDWTESEFYSWMDTLPMDQSVAVFMELLEMQATD